jgi:hypothetical protein
MYRLKINTGWLQSILLHAWGEGNINLDSFNKFPEAQRIATVNGFKTTSQYILMFMDRKGLLNKKSLKCYEDNYSITVAGINELKKIKQDKKEMVEYIQ